MSNPETPGGTKTSATPPAWLSSIQLLGIDIRAKIGYFTMATVETPLLAGLQPVTASTAAKADDDNEEVENPNRPKGFTFAVVYACILMGDFVVGYDTSCVSTLTPVITDEFASIDDLGWYGIA